MVCLNIEGLLKEHNKSRYMLVEALNSNYTVINSMINNKTTGIKFETINKLCDFFNCTPADLFIKD